MSWLFLSIFPGWIGIWSEGFGEGGKPEDLEKKFSEQGQESTINWTQVLQISLPIIYFYLVKLKKWHLSFPVLFFKDSKSTQCWIKMKDFGSYHKRSGTQPKPQQQEVSTLQHLAPRNRSSRGTTKISHAYFTKTDFASSHSKNLIITGPSMAFQKFTFTKWEFLGNDCLEAVIMLCNAMQN